jgi:hypothetical protein
MKVEKLDNPKETTAMVKKDGKIATLKRDEAAWTSTATVLSPGASRRGGPALRMPPGQPTGVSTNPPNSIPVPGAQPASPNGVIKAPAIPRPATVPPQPGPVPAAPAPASDARKRIR